MIRTRDIWKECMMQPTVIRSVRASQLSSEMRAIVSAYRRMAPRGFQLQRSRSNWYRRAVAPDWRPEFIHYELADWRWFGGHKLGAEIHLEGKWWSQRMSGIVKAFGPELRETYTAATVEWDRYWGGGRLAVLFDPQTAASKIASAMVEIIQRSWEILDKAYQYEGWTDVKLL
jgi:hypothetical protein